MTKACDPISILLFITLGFLSLDSAAQTDSTEQLLLKQQLKEKGWSFKTNATAESMITVDGMESFPYFLQSFLSDSTFRDSRIRYPISISSKEGTTFSKNIPFDTMRLTHTRQFLLTSVDSITRVMYRQNLEYTFKYFDGHWYLATLAKTD